jgi:hypothetical protein
VSRRRVHWPASLTYALSGPVDCITRDAASCAARTDTQQSSSPRTKWLWRTCAHAFKVNDSWIGGPNTRASNESMMFNRVRCLVSCYNLINTILVASADNFTSPRRTTRHVSVVNACSDDIWRKLRQPFAYVMASILLSLRSSRHDPRCLRLAHPGHLHVILTSVNFQGSFDPASSRLQTQYSLHLPLYVTSFPALRCR